MERLLSEWNGSMLSCIKGQKKVNLKRKIRILALNDNILSLSEVKQYIVSLLCDANKCNNPYLYCRQ